jgi:predicted RNA-binding protein with PUA-like domain
MKENAPMAHWLFKSEPQTWSWDQQVARGDKGEGWDGVRNHQASNNMKAMKKGDLGFFYHSGEERRIVGVVEVIGEYVPDPTDPSGKFGLVRVKARKSLPRPVTLAEIKAEPALGDLLLVRHSRLSVSPVDDAAWRRICAMGGLDPVP